jgi:hypothetical protein
MPLRCEPSVCTRVCACVCVCVRARARYKWLAGQPLAMNITEHSQLKFKLTGRRLGARPLFIFYLFYFLLCIFRTQLFLC